jgi:polyisoprenoid-binding protein YceI
LLALLVGCWTPRVAWAAPVTYDLQGSLMILVYKDPDTLGGAAAHDHVIEAAGWSGTGRWDPLDLGACGMTITVPVDQLVVDAAEIRTKLEYDSVPTERERQIIRDHMLGEDQLHAAAFPSIDFNATLCQDIGSDRIMVTGDLTIRGVTQSVSLPMALSGDPQAFSAEGALKINATDYGFEPYSAARGAIKNQDAMILIVNLQGQPR